MAEWVNVRFKRVDPGYFNTLGIPLLAGRGIAARDREGAPNAVVVNEALAARLAEVAGIKDPVGQSVRLSCPYYVRKGGRMLEGQIVGVIRSERVAAPGRPDPPVVYVSLAQVPHPEIKLIVRTEAEPASVMPGIREAVREVDPNLPLGDIATMQQVRDRTLTGISRPAADRRVCLRRRAARRPTAACSHAAAAAPGDRTRMVLGARHYFRRTCGARCP
jgi:putative ABC transport system permease protein